MTTVARQIPTTGGLRSITVPVPVTMVPQHPGGVKAYVRAQNNKASINQTPRNGDISTQSTEERPRKTVSVSEGNSPPPPPTRTTSARNVKLPYKEDVVLRDQPHPNTGRASSVDRAGREEGSDDMTTGEGRALAGKEEVQYLRQRSKTETSRRSDSKPGGKNHFNTVQWRGDMRFNPYTGTTAQSIHSKFSASQPQLNIEQILMKPNDRIKKSMFEPETGYEQEEGMGEDYGSGYTPALMKISHGTIQKHAVAVTTPIVPPKVMNRSGSDPNILESRLDRSGMTRVKNNSPGVQDGKNGSGKAVQSPTHRRQERHSVSGSTSTDASRLTTPIARAYREHLMDKMEKKKHASTSVSPSPSSSSAESGTLLAQQTQAQTGGDAGDTLSSKLRSITPSQLQSIDLPDRAYYPRILPPPNTDHKQDQPAETMHNGGHPHNPFLLHSSAPNTSYDVPDGAYNGFSYGTLPRRKPDVNQVQAVNSGFKDRTQSVNGLYSAQMSQSYAAQPQNQEWNKSNDFTRSLSAIEQSQFHQASMPAHQSYSKSQEAPPAGSGAQYWRNGATGDQFYSRNSTSSTAASGSQSSTQPSSSSNSQTDSQTDSYTAVRRGNPAMNTAWRAANETALINRASRGPPVSKYGRSTTPTGSQGTDTANQKPQVLPKPKRNGSLTPPPAIHERSTSDPSHNYGPATTQTLSGGHATPPASNTPLPKSNSFDSDLRQQSSHQQGRTKHRLPGQQISTSLLEIREADESEGRDKKKVGRSRANFADYVSLNAASLPKRIRVVRGFSSGSTDVTISQDEEFDLHFVRSVKSIQIADSSGVDYTIPLTSVAKFSLVYDPFGAESMAMQGFYFKTAGVLMDLRNPPKVVAATQAFDGGQPESSVEEGEILVLDGIKNVFHGRLLKAFSLRHLVTKYIDEKCSGNFSTTPDKIKMSLAEIYEASVPLPQKARLYPTSSILGSVQAPWQSDPVVLRQFTMAKSVIATTLTSSTAFVPTSKLPTIVGLSLDLDIDVREVPLLETRLLQMRKKTESLLDNFGKVSMIPYVDMPTTASYLAQCALLLNLDPKLKNYDDTEILTPNAVTTPKHRTSSVNQASKNTRISESAIVSSSALDRNRDSRIKALEEKYSALESRVQEACENMNKVSLKVDQIHIYLSKAQNAMAKHKKQLQESEKRSTRKSSDSTSTRPHSSAGNISTSKTSSYNSASSVSTSFSRADSRQSLKLSSESDSVDGGNDQRSVNDDVFVARPSSASKPPILPKPKQLLTKTSKPQKADVSSHVAEAKRKFSFGESNRQVVGVVNYRIAEAKRKLSLGGGNRQTADASYPHINEAERRLSFGDTNHQTATKTISKENAMPKITAKPVEVAVSHVTKEHDDSVDLKHYLLDTTPKQKPASANGMPSNAAAGNGDSAALDFESIDAITDDLTDWCTQVEDELTQLYNESILSVS